MLRLLWFSITEGITSLWRSRVLNLLSIGTIMFAMFILGSFVFVAINLKNVTIDWREQIQFNIFLLEGLDPVQREALEVLLKENLFVEKVDYISKEEAQRRFEGDFAGYGEAIQTIEENPFPASFQVTMMKGTGAESFQKLRGDLAGREGVEDIYYDEEIFKRLDFLANLIQMAGWFFGGIMIFSSIFSISNVLKLTFFTRRDEVDIMKLVGASRSSIRGPFIIEAILQGLVGAIFGVALVFIGHITLVAYLNNHPGSLFGNLTPTFLPLRWVAFLIGAGGLSGLLGSIFSLNQFLEEHISYQ